MEVTGIVLLTLPLAGAGGTAFPARDLATLLAAGVIVVSLLLASVALPRALRRLQPPDEQAQHDAEDAVRRSAARAAVAALRAERTELLRCGRAQGVGEVALHRLVREVDLLETRHGG